MVSTMVLALRMHSKRVVKRFLNYHGNSKFALKLPLVNPPLVFVVMLYPVDLHQTAFQQACVVLWEHFAFTSLIRFS